MEIYINGNKIDYQPLFPLTWGNFFQKLLENENYIPKDHGIVAVSVDDTDSLNMMTEQSEKMVSDNIKVIRIATKDSLAITREGFSKASTLLENITGVIIDAADLYRQGKLKDTSDKIVKIKNFFIETFKPIIDFINSVGISFSLNFDALPYDSNTTLREKVGQFLKTVDELEVALEKQDYVEIADYLEYRLAEDINGLNNIVNLLLQEVEAHHAKIA